MCISVYYEHACRDPSRVLGLLEMEIHTGLWVLGIEPGLDTFEELLVLLTAESSLQEYVFISLTIKGFEYLIFCVLLFLL